MKFLLRSPVVAALLFLAGIALLQPAQSTLYKWSQAPGSNSNADSTINWAEGMAPSAVNDSARAMMAAIAKFRDDTNGSLTTAGGTTNYTLTSNQVFASLTVMSGQTIRAKMNATNAASPTLNVDGLGAKNIVRVTGSAIPTGALIANGVYDFTYNNSNSEWTVVDGTFAGIPTGSKMPFWQSSCPTGWTKDSTAGLENAAMVTTTSNGGTTAGSTAFTTVMAARTIAQANLPSYTLPNTLGASITIGDNVFAVQSVQAGVTANVLAQGGNPLGITGSGSITGSVTSGGSGTAMDFATKYSVFIVCGKD